MKLLTLGDSYTYGDELEHREKDSWPALLSGYLGAELLNLGERSGSNEFIFRTLINECELNNYDLIVIGWSSFGRQEWYDEHGRWHYWPGRGLYTDDKRLNRDVLVDYVTDHHNPKHLVNKSLSLIIGAINYLENKNVNYIMVSTWWTDWYVNNFINSDPLFKYVNADKFLGWGNLGMAEYVYPCERGPRGHWLENGHKKVADWIYNFYLEKYDG